MAEVRALPASHRVQVGGRCLRFRFSEDERLEVAGIDVETELTAARLVGRIEPWLWAIVLMQGIAGQSAEPRAAVAQALRRARRERDQILGRTLFSVRTEEPLTWCLVQHELLEQRLAADPKTPASAMSLLAMLGDDSLSASLARNPSANPELLERLLRSGSLVRRDAARHPALPADRLPALARAGDPWVRAGLAARDDLPLEVHRLLAQDPVWWVRGVAAGNQHLPPELFSEMATDDYADVLLALIANPSCPREVVRRLTQDESRLVAIQAELRLQRTPEPEPGSGSVAPDSNPG